MPVLGQYWENPADLILSDIIWVIFLDLTTPHVEEGLFMLFTGKAVHLIMSVLNFM